MKGYMFGLASTEKNLVNERKFVGSAAYLDVLRCILDAQCLPDPSYPLGQINSIYFDSPARTAYFEKLNGDNRKSKIRIRWYGADDEAAAEKAGAGKTAERTAEATTTAFIEVKQRVGASRRKMRLAVEVSSRWIRRVALEDERLVQWLREKSVQMEAAEIPVQFVPSICISYQRRRYVCPASGSRVSMDYAVRSERVNGNLFPFVAPAELDVALCEFKNDDGTPPPWAESLYEAGFRWRSFSKYGECMSKILLGGAV